MDSVAQRLHLLPDQGVDESRPLEYKSSGRGDDLLVHSDTVGLLDAGSSLPSSFIQGHPLTKHMIDWRSFQSCS